MSRDLPRQRADVAIIGAGFAGLSAGVRLASAGARVVVVEQAPRLGGRASAFTDRATGDRVDNGQHVLFGCYRETYTFLRQIGAESLAPLQARLRLAMADTAGRLVELECPDLPPPWHLVGGLMRWKALPVGDRLAALRVGRFLHRMRRKGQGGSSVVPSDMTVTGWLNRLRQPGTVRDWLWHPLAVAALNQSPDVAAAAPFVEVLARLFGPAASDSAVGLASVPLDEMYAVPAVRFIESRGGAVHLKAPGKVLVGADGIVRGVRTPAQDIEARDVISAVPWHALEHVWASDVPGAMTPVVRAARAIDSAPIVTVNLWLDRPVMNTAFVGLVGAPVHWVFDKAAIVGERAAHLAAVTSGADALAAATNDDATRLVVASLLPILPAMRQARVLRSVVVREHRATFSVAPGGPVRPQATTPVPGFYLAGDWTDTGLPATIESAVVSGHRAADLVIEARRMPNAGP